MELELKHLAPYLPYGFKLYGASDIWEMHSLGIEEICIANGLHIQTLSFNDCLSDYSPILHPLSDLTKEIEHNGERFVPMFELVSLNHKTLSHLNSDGIITASKRLIKDVINQQLPYLYFIKLLEWHFDVFNLIPNLAIDINTLK